MRFALAVHVNAGSLLGGRRGKGSLHQLRHLVEDPLDFPRRTIRGAKPLQLSGWNGRLNSRQCQVGGRDGYSIGGEPVRHIFFPSLVSRIPTIARRLILSPAAAHPFPEPAQ